MSDCASDLSDFSLSIWAFRADLHCSSSNSLSLRETLDRAEEEAREGRWRRRMEEERGVCLEAVKNWRCGESRLGFWEGCLGVLKLEMSLRSDDEEGGFGECRCFASMVCE